MSEMPKVLEVRELTKRYGGVTALDSVSIEVRSGEVLGVIGPNGAGKSTLVGVIGGSLQASAGMVSIAGTDISSLSAPERARFGVGRTHQIPRPFVNMTVMENLLLAASNSGRSERSSTRRHECVEILAQTGLSSVADQPAGKLTLIRRKRLELARALALKPKILMLDEIGAGLVESETNELIALINSLRSSVESMLLIEHVMEVITSCCDRTAVLDFGKIITVGETRAVLANPVVAAIYLGTGAADHAANDNIAIAAEKMIDGEATEKDDDRLSLGDNFRNALRPLVTASNNQMDSTLPLLSINNASVHYGGLRALNAVDFKVFPGETVALLGANGAGKTTLTRAIAGARSLSSGEIFFEGELISQMRPDQVREVGIAQCMEGRRIFGTLSIEENLILGSKGAKKETRDIRLSAVYEVFPVLKERRKSPGTSLSGGQQQMLAIGRALMSAPKLVIFDEISLGLAPIAVDRLYEALTAIKASGISIILVEQNVKRSLELAERAYVLSQGRVVINSSAKEVLDHPDLLSSYVG